MRANQEDCLSILSGLQGWSWHWMFCAWSWNCFTTIISLTSRRLRIWHWLSATNIPKVGQLEFLKMKEKKRKRILNRSSPSLSGIDELRIAAFLISQFLHLTICANVAPSDFQRLVDSLKCLHKSKAKTWIIMNPLSSNRSAKISPVLA